jgi:hypothetical protein
MAGCPHIFRLFGGRFKGVDAGPLLLFGPSGAAGKKYIYFSGIAGVIDLKAAP